MIQIPQWLHEMDPDMLPDQHRKLMEIVGYEKMLELISNFSGDYLYIPKLDALIKEVRNQNLLADHAKGVLPPELAHRYDLSVVQVYEIIKRDRNAKAAEKGQCSLFDSAAI